MFCRKVILMMSLIVKNVSQQDFQRHPVWAEIEEPGDFEFIEAWGEMGAQIVREIQASGYSECYFPVLQLDDNWDGFRIVNIRATITAADGTEFPGYVTGTNPHALCLFPESGESGYVGFNIHSRDWAEETLLELREVTQKPLSPLFPLRYETGLRDTRGERIQGFFGYGSQISQYLAQEHGFDLQQDDTVRVTSLRLTDREEYEAKSNLRAPKVGDIGHVLRCYDPRQHAAPFVVACVDKPPGEFWETAWHATFAADELELVDRKPLNKLRTYWSLS